MKITRKFLKVGEKRKTLESKQGSKILHGIPVKEMKVVSCYTPERDCQFFPTTAELLGTAYIAHQLLADFTS